MQIINIKDKNSIEKTAEILKAGGVVVFPTDTVYGIGCILDEIVIKKLYKLKKRPISQPTAILISEKILNKKYWSLKNTIGGFKKGKITIIMSVTKMNMDIPKVLIKDGKVGIRIPNHKWLQKLIDKVGPIVASSANKKGEPAPSKFDEISDEILGEVYLVIKSAERLSGKPSKVYDIEKNKFIRD